MLAFCFASWLAQPARADSGLTAVPADGKPRGLELRAQTVDVNVVHEAGRVFADTEAWLRLSNPTTRTVTVPVGLLGVQAAGLPMTDTITGLRLRLEETPLDLRPAAPGEAQPGIRYVAEISLPARGTLSLRINYRQALTDTGVLALFGYPLAAADQWEHTPESLRVTVRFDAPMPAEELLGLSPAPRKRTNQELTWQWAATRAQEDIWIALISPAWWAQLSAARSAATAPAAGPADHMLLAGYYQELAGLPALPFLPGADFYARYYAASVAELQAAAAQGSAAGKMTADAIAAHTTLARLYLEQARRAGAGNADPYLQLSAAEVESAAAGGSTSPDLAALAAQIYAPLAQGARLRGDEAAAQKLLARLAAFQPGAGSASEADKAAEAASAVDAADRGDLATARQLVAGAFGPAAAMLPGAPPPRARQILIAVSTQPAHRAITVHFAGVDDPAGLRALLERAAAALQAVPGAQLSAGADSLSIRFDFRTGPELAAMQARLAAALPGDPELALLSAVLSPQWIWWQTHEDLLRPTVHYGEHADLLPAWLRWQALAGRLEAPAAGTVITSTTAVTATAAALAHVQRALWSADAASWRAVMADSRVDYHAQVTPAAAAREWEIPAGGARVLTVTASAILMDRARWLAGAAILLLVVLALLVWRA